MTLEHIPPPISSNTGCWEASFYTWRPAICSALHFKSDLPQRVLERTMGRRTIDTTLSSWYEVRDLKNMMNKTGILNSVLLAISVPFSKEGKERRKITAIYVRSKLDLLTRSQYFSLSPALSRRMVVFWRGALKSGMRRKWVWPEFYDKMSSAHIKMWY